MHAREVYAREGARKSSARATRRNEKHRRELIKRGVSGGTRACSAADLSSKTPRLRVLYMYFLTCKCRVFLYDIILNAKKRFTCKICNN